MARAPEIGNDLDDEERVFIESFEAADTPLTRPLTDARKREIEAMARATMTDERARISLRVSKRDLVRLKSRALQAGVPYQTLINSFLRDCAEQEHVRARPFCSAFSSGIC